MATNLQLTFLEYLVLKNLMILHSLISRHELNKTSTPLIDKNNHNILWLT
ncbi:hypothetical protein XNC1_1666 [Xenorhabdus nematophila ATCC 19061]|uniref:Uncharacterized protein n=1 Tax=Xenorhabdus nematophila (strain ATCC 19061 / DSM 3370 / CCUG 14189 / LMG 1036 / NCIMB 9965 / AN6) TaxID=406817 RepID=D3VC73_XENNA|nr:hypothetical protein XNC1_1666 [Xenorhabdus nematophila ATCC 19061]CEK22608.1 hypothetical protein XNC2_1614 [Xenorhabdus nematophila AN6/1]